MLLGREAELVFEPILDDCLKNKGSIIDGFSLKKVVCGEFQFRRRQKCREPVKPAI